MQYLVGFLKKTSCFVCSCSGRCYVVDVNIVTIDDEDSDPEPQIEVD